MSYTLQKTYTNREKTAFVANYNYKQGLTTKETDTALYTLKAHEKIFYKWLKNDLGRYHFNGCKFT